MIRRAIFTTLIAFSISVVADTSAPTNALQNPETFTLQELLVTGSSQLKLMSLSILTQEKLNGGVNESFLPGFKSCSEDPALPVRSVTAKLLGTHFIKDNDSPNPEAVALLIKLANDESSDVRHRAVYYGLTEIKYKTPELVELLLTIATLEHSEVLYDKIIISLASYQLQATEILDAKLAEDDNIAFYEIYEDFTGGKPEHADKYLNMPSSRPRLFIIKGEDLDLKSAKSELEAALKSAGIENPDVQLSETGEAYVLIVKTHITRDYQTTNKLLSNHSKFKITQQMWLTPELEIQLEAMQKASINKQ